MDKFSDNLHSAPPGTFQPTTVSALFRKLNIRDADQETKTSAIRDWLDDHEPSALMKHSLRREGYSALLHVTA